MYPDYLFLPVAGDELCLGILCFRLTSARRHCTKGTRSCQSCRGKGRCSQHSQRRSVVRMVGPARATIPARPGQFACMRKRKTKQYCLIRGAASRWWHEHWFRVVGRVPRFVTNSCALVFRDSTLECLFLHAFVIPFAGGAGERIEN